MKGKLVHKWENCEGPWRKWQWKRLNENWCELKSFGFVDERSTSPDYIGSGFSFCKYELCFFLMKSTINDPTCSEGPIWLGFYESASQKCSFEKLWSVKKNLQKLILAKLFCHKLLIGSFGKDCFRHLGA